MMNFKLLITLAGMMIFTVSCTNPIAPYVDSRREAGQLYMVGKSTPEKVSICYNSASATPEEIVALAMAECAKYGKTKIELAAQNHLDCALFVPTRVEYWCK